MYTCTCTERYVCVTTLLKNYITHRFQKYSRCSNDQNPPAPAKAKPVEKKKIQQTKSVISIISISTRMSKPTLSPHFLKSLGNNQARQNIFGGTYLSLRIRVLSRLFGTFLHHFFRRFGRAGGNQELARIGSWQGKSHTKHTHHHNCTHEIILGERQRPTVTRACLLIIGSVFPKVPTTLHNE